MSTAYPKALSIELRNRLKRAAAGHGGGIQDFEWGLLEEGAELEIAYIQGMPGAAKAPSLGLSSPPKKRDYKTYSVDTGMYRRCTQRTAAKMSSVCTVL